MNIKCHTGVDFPANSYDASVFQFTGMQFGHALNGASGMPVPGMSQSLNPVEEMDHRFVNLLLSIVFVCPVHRHKADRHTS